MEMPPHYPSTITTARCMQALQLSFVWFPVHNLKIVYCDRCDASLWATNDKLSPQLFQSNQLKEPLEGLDCIAKMQTAYNCFFKKYLIGELIHIKRFVVDRKNDKLLLMES